MTDEELLAIEDAVATLAQSRNLNDDESDAIDSLRASAPRLLAEVWRLRDEVARVAGVARKACDAVESLAWSAPLGPLIKVRSRINVIRAAITTPDRAAVVAAVERYGEAARLYGVTAGNGEPWVRLCADRAKADAAKAALLALVGGGE